MIVKGRSRANGDQLGAYLLDAARNDAVDVLEIRHTEFGDLRAAIRDMQDMTDTGQRGIKGSITPRSAQPTATTSMTGSGGAPPTGSRPSWG